MYNKKEKSGCQHPEKLKGKPEQCSPEQIKECHGEVEGHPCEPAEPKGDQKGCCGSSKHACCE
jgi:hypothetical protein